MKRASWAAAILMTLLVAGCATSGDYCDIARPIRPSIEDRLTDGTKIVILAENQKLEKLCGVKP
ncbi:hypothetical protein GCM10010136_02430 [Limoniibacter endophyticus]|uniref:Uncharacterized protein n=1 Tax=Limoniibacter endophyticus TaxID=1565040 RepID=A0A8J3GEP6_9HYPH|nr:hypothetical protein GCM10010136_02430 [Limoniibacter endophyticus]